MTNGQKFLAVLITLILLTIGTVSAVEDTTISNTDNTNNLEPSTNDIKLDSSNSNDKSTYNLDLKINYEYSENNNVMNPTINIKESNNTLNLNKTYSNDIYQVKLNSNSNSILNITVSAPGYITQSQLLTINNNQSDLLGNLVFNMKATESYQLGRDVTAKADSLLNFNTADEILAITTAGVPKLNGQTSEDAIEAILNYGNRISYGLGNMLMLRQTATSPIDFCFVTRNGNKLNAVIFLNGSTTYSYLGSISENMTKAQWNQLYKAVGGENAFSFASLANGWYDNVSYLVLQEAAFHGHICEGTLGGYTITEALMQYYPPIKATDGGSGSPGDITSYKVLGIPGDSASDAVLFFLDATAGKSGYVGFDTTSTGATTNMMAFIRWKDAVVTYNKTSNKYEVTSPGSGTLILMQYNSAENKKLFEKETGIKGNGSLEQLKYNTWWINRINTNPASLVSILLEKENLTEKQYYYLIGSAKNITFPTSKNATNAGETRIEAIEAHGLDYNYIMSLNLPNAIRNNTIANRGNLTYNDFKEIGLRASNLAKDIFKKELGIEIEKGMPNFEILTTAGYSYIKEQSTEAVWDGIFEVFGSRLSRYTLLPDHRPMWKPLWFTFVLKQDDGKLMSVYIRYNEDGTYFIGSYNGTHVHDIGMNTLNNSKLSSAISSNVFPDGNWFNIQSLTNAWAGDLAFDQLVTFLFHGHACPGVQPGFFMTDYIQSNYPLNENESYFYIASSIYCKDDSLEYLLGISPGLGNYMDQRLTSDDVESDYINGATEEGVLVIWDNELNIGRAVIMNFKWATIDTSSAATSEAKRATTIQAFIDLYNGVSNPNIKEGNSILGSETRYITQEQFNFIKSGGGKDTNAISYLKSLPNMSKQDLLDSMNKNKDNQNNGTVIVDNDGSSSSASNNIQSSQSSGASNSGSNSLGSTSASNSNLGSSNSIGSNSVSSSSSSSSDAKGAAYEINQQASSSSGINSNNLIYAIILVLIIGAFAGFGFIKTRKNE